MDTAFIFDIDSTTADVKHREQYAFDHRWKEFYAHQSEDTPIETTVVIIRALKQAGHKIVFLTGRPSHYRELTEAWLKKYEIPFDELILHEKEDSSSDTRYKMWQLAILKSKYKVLGVFEDRAKNVKMFRESGITAFDIAGNQW